MRIVSWSMVSIFAIIFACLLTIVSEDLFSIENYEFRIPWE